jgi:hypothetical protein
LSNWAIVRALLKDDEAEIFSATHFDFLVLACQPVRCSKSAAIGVIGCDTQSPRLSVELLPLKG